jgi:hypothetical protein
MGTGVAFGGGKWVWGSSLEAPKMGVLQYQGDQALSYAHVQ